MLPIESFYLTFQFQGIERNTFTSSLLKHDVTAYICPYDYEHQTAGFWIGLLINGDYVLHITNELHRLIGTYGEVGYLSISRFNLHEYPYLDQGTYIRSIEKFKIAEIDALVSYPYANHGLDAYTECGLCFTSFDGRSITICSGAFPSAVVMQGPSFKQPFDTECYIEEMRRIKF